MERYDALIIGAGFGGLGAGLTLAERGARVAICESLRYPGGCASTFTRAGVRFESGATLFSGLAPHQLFGRWNEAHQMGVEVDWIDPVVEMRLPDRVVPVWRDRERFVESLCQAPGAPAAKIRRFFAWQARTADTLWRLFDDPSLLPPLTARTLLRHAGNLPELLPLVRWVGRPLVAVLKRFGLADYAPLRHLLDAWCQITVQARAADAEALFALAAIDYFWRGTGHVRGGIGALAFGLLDAMKAQGADVYLSNRVKGLERDDEGWRVETRRGPMHARHVVANVLPGALQTLLGRQVPQLGALSAQVQSGWGAVMLYLVADPPPSAHPEAHHLQMVLDADAPYAAGNHLFVSISGAHEDRGAGDRRTLTVSTHVPLRTLWSLDDAGQATYVEGVQNLMRKGLARAAPEWWTRRVSEMPGSPRTFERFTGRPNGAVGGIPRRAGLKQYLAALRGAVEPGLWMVGDSVFPGQSTFACGLGGMRTAERVLSALPSRELAIREALEPA